MFLEVEIADMISKPLFDSIEPMHLNSGKVDKHYLSWLKWNIHTPRKHKCVVFM